MARTKPRRQPKSQLVDEPLPRPAYDLAPLEAPSLGSNRYAKEKTGYSLYVADYELYISKLASIKAAFKEKQAIGKNKPKYDVVRLPNETRREMIYRIMANDGYGRKTILGPQKEVFADTVAFSYYGAVFTVPVKGVEKQVDLPLLASFTAEKKLPRHGNAPLSYYVDEEELLTTDNIPEPVYVIREKKKGPAVTPKKVRTPEEQQAFETRNKSRQERNAWFSSRKLELVKGKLEEKLVTSLAKRAAAVKTADKTVDTKLDLDGWRVVTNKRAEKKKVRLVERNGGNKKFTDYVVRNK